MTGAGDQPQTPCWRRVGVWGTVRPRCPELEQVVHCHNCPVFAQAARVRLEASGLEPQPLSAAPAEVPAGRISLTVFRVSGLWLALDTPLVEQVAPRAVVRPLPHRGHTLVRGLVNVRGELLTCVSLSRLLGIERARTTRDDAARGIYERLVVIRGEGLRVAFRVGEIRGVYHYPPEDIAPPADDMPDGARPYVEGCVTAKLRSSQETRCARLRAGRLLADVKEALA